MAQHCYRSVENVVTHLKLHSVFVCDINLKSVHRSGSGNINHNVFSDTPEKIMEVTLETHKKAVGSRHPITETPINHRPPPYSNRNNLLQCNIHTATGHIHIETGYFILNGGGAVIEGGGR